MIKENMTMPFEKKEVQLFLNELASATPTPGGGSSAALCGAIAAALVSMVANLTIGKEKHKENWLIMKEVVARSEFLRFKFMDLANKDINAYDTYMTALRMPKKTEEEKKVRELALEEARVCTTEVPLDTIETCTEVVRLTFKATKYGNPNALSDAASAAVLAEAVARAAACSVRANLPGIKNKFFAAHCKTRMLVALEEVKRELNETETLINERFE